MFRSCTFGIAKAMTLNRGREIKSQESAADAAIFSFLKRPSPLNCRSHCQNHRKWDKSRGKYRLTDRLFTGMKFAPFDGHFEAYSGLKRGDIFAFAYGCVRWVLILFLDSR